MRILVTGAAGFVGSTLVDRLLADGHQVVGIDNLSTGVVTNLEDACRYNALSPRRFTFVQVDIQAPELTDIVAGTNPDVIFHLAAQVDPEVSVSDPQFDARSNVLGTINLCEASRRAGVQRIVYAGCGESRYAAPASLPVDESNRVDPLSPYAAAKLAGELYSARLCRNVRAGADLPSVSQRLWTASECARRGGCDRSSRQNHDHWSAVRREQGRRWRR